MSAQGYDVSASDFWDERRGPLSYSLRCSSPEQKKAVMANRRRVEDVQKQAADILRQSNAGKRRLHTVQEVVDFLESLPEQVTADIEFVGAGLLRNVFTDDQDLYSVSEIELTRIYSIRIMGWEYFRLEGESGWDLREGIVFARGRKKMASQRELLQKVFDRYVDMPDYASDGNVSEEQLREALNAYECEHGDGFEPVFYRRSKDGQLYVRDVMNPCNGEDEYFEDMESIDLEEAVEQFWKSNWRVYEAYDE